MRKVSVTIMLAIALAGCASPQVVTLAPPRIAVPQIKDAVRKSKLPMHCPRRPTLKEDATLGDTAEWAAKIVRAYDICVVRNDAKARLIENEKPLGGKTEK